MDSAIQIDKTPIKADEPIKPRRTDKQIWGIYIALCIISVIELYSASSFEVTAANVFAPVLRHVMFLLFGLAIMLLLQNTHYKKFYNFTWAFFVISVGAMIYTIFFGTRINGATRCFSLMGFTVQPAEMIKLSVALIVARILCKEQMKGVNDVTNKGVVWVTLAILLSCALLFSEGLTNTILLTTIGLSMMLIGGVGWKKFFIVVGVFALCGCLGYLWKEYAPTVNSQTPTETTVREIPDLNLKVGIDDEEVSQEASGAGRMPTWKKRLTRYFKKDKYTEDINNENRQEIYSYIAQAHGGVLGVMPGNSRETARLPLAYSDYIYAIIIEELGLVGGIIVLVLYLWLLARAGRVASRCQTAFPALLVIGTAVFITIQAICHMAIVTGVMPVSGQPLPLISKGGTSILITSVALGVMLSVSRHAARKGKKAEIKEEMSELPDEVKALNPT